MDETGIIVTSRTTDPVTIAGLAVALIALVGLLCWFNQALVVSVLGSGRVALSPDTALCVFLMGVLLIVPARPVQTVLVGAVGLVLAVGAFLPSGMGPLVALLMAASLASLLLRPWPAGCAGVASAGLAAAALLAVLPGGVPLAATFCCLILFAGVLLGSAPRAPVVKTLFGGSRVPQLLRSLAAGIYFVFVASVAREIYLSGLGRGTPFLTYFPAIMIAAILADSSAGLVAAVGATAATFFWVEQGTPTGPEVVALVLFLLSSGFVLVISAGWQRAMRQSEESRKREQQQMAELRTLLHALEVNEERLRLATESIHDSIWDWDLTTGIVYRSATWWTMLGYAQPEGSATLGETRSLIHPDDRARVAKASREAIEKGSHYRVEARMKHADGSWIWVESRGRVSATDAAGTPTRVSGVNTNIHARKEAEQEKERLQVRLQRAQKMESLGILAAGIAHDMNNILGAILTLASSYLLLHKEPTQTAQSFEKISRASKRGREMVKGLLGFSRQTPMVQELFDLNDLITEEMGFLKQTILGPVKLELDLDPKPMAVRGDPNAIKNLLMNLCVNSVDAMADPGTITVRTRSKADSSIEVRVIDDGAGMTPDVLSKALDPFFTTKAMGKGTGLGLTTAFGTVQNHGGQLEIQSSPGKGTTVIISLPEADRGAAEVPVPPEAPAKARSLRILLVDDDTMMLEASSELVGLMGHQVLSATSGEAALGLLEGGAVDLVILDMTMPGLGGRGTLPLLRGLYPDLPVVLATGLADESAQALVGQFDRVALLAKPYDYTEIRTMIAAMTG